jgi:hypothetical protein
MKEGGRDLIEVLFSVVLEIEAGSNRKIIRILIVLANVIGHILISQLWSHLHSPHVHLLKDYATSLASHVFRMI